MKIALPRTGDPKIDEAIDEIEIAINAIHTRLDTGDDGTIDTTASQTITVVGGLITDIS